MPPPSDAQAWAEFEHLTSVGVTPAIAAVLVLGIAGGRVRAIRIPHGHVRGYWLERSRGLVTCPACRAAWRLYLAPHREHERRARIARLRRSA